MKQTEPHESTSIVGLDTGVLKLIRFQAFTVYLPVSSFKSKTSESWQGFNGNCRKIQIQCQLAKTKRKIQRLHSPYCQYQERLPSQSHQSEISKTTQMIIEDLRSVTCLNRQKVLRQNGMGRNVKAKSGLNHAQYFLEQATGMKCADSLSNKAALARWSGTGNTPCLHQSEVRLLWSYSKRKTASHKVNSSAFE